MQTNNALRTAVTGLSGALACTAAHELGRKTLRGAPRMDIVGKRSVKRLMKFAGRRPPHGKKLYRTALAAEIASNAAYYALVARRGGGIGRGLISGVLAGIGGVFFTPKLGLGWWPVRRSQRTEWLTLSWYALGGLTAGILSRAWRRA